MKKTLGTWQIWKAPLLLGAISLVGLLAALFSDGIGDAVSWLALAVPLVTLAWYLKPIRLGGDRRRVLD